MAASGWVAAGLSANIAGSFLVSAEAIGLENLLSLQKAFAFTHAHLVWPIYYTDDPDPQAYVPRRPWYFSWYLWHGAGAVAFSAGLALALRIAQFDFSTIPPLLFHHAAVLTALIVIGSAWLVTFGLFILGEFAVHGLAAGLLRLAIAILVWVRSHARDGVAGSVGFGLLTAGFLLQLVG